MGALKKSTCVVPAPDKKEQPKPNLKIVPADNPNSAAEKAEIERMKKVINEKIKDPELARKAALIISDMLNK